VDEGTLAMKKIVITSSTPEFLPGVQALRNSLKLHHPDAELWCFYYSKGQDVELPADVNYIHEAEHLGPLIDDGSNFRHGLPIGPDMYARILIPNYFESGRIFYVDADCLILNDLSELWTMDLQGYPTACVYRPDIGWHAGGRQWTMASGTFLCDVQAWKNYNGGLTEYMYNVMNHDAQKLKKFNLNVESVMSYAHDGKFLHLDAAYQNLTYYGCLVKNDKVAHYAGPKPWLIEDHTDKKRTVNYREMWLAYYDNDLEMIKRLSDELPETRAKNAMTRENRGQRPHLSEREVEQNNNRFLEIYNRVQGK
jgi:lipopolysaccharide biosynthesis glycosyltransferase